MKNGLALVSVFTLLLPETGHSENIDWSQPPVACVEEVVPAVPDIPCLQLQNVSDPLKDFPNDLPEQELLYWQSHKTALQYCRAKEILRRETLKPGSFSAVTVELSWMRSIAVQSSNDKVDAIYEASRVQRIPAAVLTGALFQESLYADLGITEDGGNYSCGLGQINTQEWCNWTNSLTPDERVSMGLSDEKLMCSLVPSTLVEPFYNIALTRLKGLPEYRLENSHFQNIKFESVVSQFPTASLETQQTRYRFVTSFLNNCSKPKLAIAAKANELRRLFDQHVPAGLQLSDTYNAGQKFEKTCRQPDTTGLYPLHDGFLLAVASYNAGPRAVDLLAHYRDWTANDLEDVKTFENLTPPDLVDAFYWSGKYNASRDAVGYTTLGGYLTYANWYRFCVLQRHIARVVQHVTLPSAGKIIDSLEGANPCSPSKYDSDGNVVKSGVPTSRQMSSGRLEAH